MISILTPDDDNELLDECINKQISLITLAYIDAWEATQDGTVRVILWGLIAKPDSDFLKFKASFSWKKPRFLLLKLGQWTICSKNCIFEWRQLPKLQNFIIAQYFNSVFVLQVIILLFWSLCLKRSVRSLCNRITTISEKSGFCYSIFLSWVGERHVSDNFYWGKNINCFLQLWS